MREVFIADDGTEFDDEWDCMEYEWICEYGPELDKIKFFDCDNKQLVWNKDDEFYYSLNRVELETEEEFNALHELAKGCGWCALFESITGPGIWVYSVSSAKYEPENTVDD